jgi:hypothetical protein
MLKHNQSFSKAFFLNIRSFLFISFIAFTISLVAQDAEEEIPTDDGIVSAGESL